MTYVKESDTSEIEELLLGCRVVDVRDDLLVLDNGTVVEVIPNDGGCSCGAGDYSIESLTKVNNIITKVEFDYDPSSDYDNGTGYKIFVYADNEKINLLSVVGNDGNGYYGTGFTLKIKA